MKGAAYGAGNAYPSISPYFASGFYRGSCCPVFCVILSNVIVMSFGFWVLVVLVCLRGISKFFTYGKENVK